MANNLVLLGAGTSGSSGSLTPPTVAPVLTVDADLGSYIANLAWTSSNKTGSAGFTYNIYLSTNGTDFVYLASTTSLTYNQDFEPDSGTYYFEIIPANDAGEGPASNGAGVALPGESEAPVLTGPSSVESGSPIALLEWNSIPGATLYSVERSPDDSTWTQIHTPTGTSQSVTLSFSPSYYRVIPFADTFEGLASNSISITIVAPPAADSYLRPDGTSTYLRPDGTSVYLRP